MRQTVDEMTDATHYSPSVEERLVVACGDPLQDILRVMDDRFDRLEIRLDRMENRLDCIEETLQSLTQNISAVTGLMEVDKSEDGGFFLVILMP
ncbi:hypothetical protein V1517DRAFT_339349, partial [Lipomyces orientalis]